MAHDKVLVLKDDLVIESSTFDPESQAPQGGITVQTIYNALDFDLKSFSSGDIISSAGVAKVLKSQVETFQENDLVLGSFDIQQYSALSADAPRARKVKLQSPNDAKIEYFISPLGVSGALAFSSFYQFCNPKKGETIYVSGRTGGIGQFIGKLALLEGLKVMMMMMMMMIFINVLCGPPEGYEDVLS